MATRIPPPQLPRHVVPLLFVDIERRFSDKSTLSSDDCALTVHSGYCHCTLHCIASFVLYLHHIVIVIRVLPLTLGRNPHRSHKKPYKHSGILHITFQLFASPKNDHYTRPGFGASCCPCSYLPTNRELAWRWIHVRLTVVVTAVGPADVVVMVSDTLTKSTTTRQSESFCVADLTTELTRGSGDVFWATPANSSLIYVNDADRVIMKGKS